MVDVIDTGPGVPSEARDHIFDRFYRTDGNEAVGTGLGLSLAKGGVEAMGGRLTSEQSGPQGSTFRITVPKNPGSGIRDPGSEVQRVRVRARRFPNPDESVQRLFRRQGRVRSA